MIAQVLAFVREEQIEFFGIGAMAAAYQTLQTALKQEIPQGSRLPRVISLAFTRPPAVAEVTPDSGVQRQPHEVSIPRPRLSSTTSRLCELFRSRGYRAKTHAPGLPGLPKMAGRLAGLGWIGRNSLLIIPGPGPRVALAAVLTDAPLPVTCKEPVENHCGNCRRCVDACPANAYTGEPFRETDPLTVRFDPDKCRRWCEELRDQRRSPEICSDEGDCCGGVCNLCAKACPYGEGKCLLGG
ncbi:MAG: hypothetical protein ABSF26_31535 [Thermoguttaceae bacterium]